ncbi:hypothetical protein PPUJ20005_38500 [Pseudomonas putida]|uniref:VPA1269 family protein n=1 Tax=Pseudomonas putida TaxID=303 RepID=UPI00235CC8DE|nr:VPA1269 family protein [Pseudomonas putida]GLO09881.1 hypothetical protein PPUJ20005_38500 [Pseudomonas putida]HDS0987034.1 hypothetical protein [Pseudomonas putida]
MAKKNLYKTYAEARTAARALKFVSSTDYIKRYKQDPRLPSNPTIQYSDFVSFSDYLGNAERFESNHHSYEEACEIVRRAGIKLKREYTEFQAGDSRLPFNPTEFYKSEWKNWSEFLDHNPRYTDYDQAREATRALNFTTKSQYINTCRKVDPLLHNHPNKVFASQWTGWEDYLGLDLDTDFISYQNAQTLVQEEKIQSEAEYSRFQKTHRRLPPSPETAWPKEWLDWPTFLSRKLAPYTTYEHAKKAVASLNIISEEEYRQGHFDDPRLPKNPQEIYKDEWNGWSDFVIGGERYPSIAEASAAACAYGFSTQAHYKAGFNKDPKLPRRPMDSYKDCWQGWHAFLGQPDRYENFDDARNAARALGCSNQTDYVRRCKLADSALYVDPATKYDQWAGWDDYLGLVKTFRYLDIAEATKLLTENKITKRSQYNAFRSSHPELPSLPHRFYREKWIDWPTFVGLRIEHYDSYNEAKEAVRELGIASNKEYKAYYLDDPKLPQHPYHVYKTEWTSWADFLPEQKKYESLELARIHACALGFKTIQEYANGHASDPMLPKRPDLYYENTWPTGGWVEFLSAAPFYSTAEEAGAAARALGFTTLQEYKEKRHLDPGLPSSIRSFYRKSIPWLNFILPKKCNTLEDVKFAIKAIGIKNSREYRVAYKKYPCLPAHPDRVFAKEWKDWYDTCGIERPYCYEDATALLRKLNLPTSGAYKKYIKETGDKKFPLTPEKVYSDEWVNWQAYLGKEEPYTLVTLREPYEKWRFAFADFLRTAKGLFKVHHLVRFVRDYIKPNNLSEDPITFFTTNDFDRDDFKEFLLRLPDSKAKQHLSTLKEFSDQFIEKNLTARCEDTNEEINLAGAVNPFHPVSLRTPKSAGLGQTSKPPLAYHHVDAIKKWIVPTTAASFSELKHLQVFDADWVDIDQALIDINDPDCVFRQENGGYKIWFPGYWMHTYALTSVPIRGVQLAYADSGECDLRIPVIREGKMIWIDNPSSLRGQTASEGFIKPYPNGDFGMHLTTNKSAEGIIGYDVPWMPEDLAKWMIRLRDWQSKYNPVDRPMPWGECVNTNYSEPERLDKGSNCFLFRDFGSEECGVSFGTRLQRRIAIALYNTAPNLATLTGSPFNVSGYRSEFTPHAMRVSLITAYVMEFRLPLSVLVKIVGHASIIMTIYYVKINGEMLRQKFNEAEKRYLHKRSKGAYQKLVEGRGHQANDVFINNNADALKQMTSQIVAGSALYRDYGICLMAASRCGDGATIDGKFIPVPAGYLGRENCIHCRHFLTGPVFLGGLLSLANEISLCCRIHIGKLEDMQDKRTELGNRIKKLAADRFDESQSGVTTEIDYKAQIDEAKSELDSLSGLINTASVAADMYLADLNAINKITQECQSLIAERASTDLQNNSTQLIVKPGHEAMVAFEEVSYFQQLHEVCENAEIYTSASADLASPERSNMIDRMAELNRLTPVMYKLDKKSQIVIGNQIVNFMIARMSWPTVSSVMDGSILMRDLPRDQRLTSQALESLLKGQNAQDVLRIEYQPNTHSDSRLKTLPSRKTQREAQGNTQGIQKSLFLQNNEVVV